MTDLLGKLTSTNPITETMLEFILGSYGTAGIAVTVLFCPKYKIAFTVKV